MHIIKVEIPEDNGVGVCENCHATKPVRPVESVGWAKESRGWFSLCFDCFAPQMWWREGKGGQVWMTPASNNRVHPTCTRRGGTVAILGKRSKPPRG